MVLIGNIKIGQRVEVLRAGYVLQGTVKFKGFLNGTPGEWVGVELDQNVGKHDGMIGGRRYFSCMAEHGIFTTAAKIRFMPTQRRLYNRYRTVDELEDDMLLTLSHTEPRRVQSPRESYVSQRYRDRATEAVFQDVDPFARPHYPLRHSVGNSFQAATMREQALQRAKCYSYKSSPFHTEYDLQPQEFIASPTIPQTHMPHSLLRRQVNRGWENDHYVRDMTVNTGRDSVYYNTWNHL